jgi:hypothetical protein
MTSKAKPYPAHICRWCGCAGNAIDLDLLCAMVIGTILTLCVLPSVYMLLAKDHGKIIHLEDEYQTSYWNVLTSLTARQGHVQLILACVINSSDVIAVLKISGELVSSIYFRFFSQINCKIYPSKNSPTNDK